MGYLSFRDATEGDILDNFEGAVASCFKMLVVLHLVLYIPSEASGSAVEGEGYERGLCGKGAGLGICAVVDSCRSALRTSFVLGYVYLLGAGRLDFVLACPRNEDPCRIGACCFFFFIIYWGHRVRAHYSERGGARVILCSKLV